MNNFNISLPRVSSDKDYLINVKGKCNGVDVSYEQMIRVPALVKPIVVITAIKVASDATTETY